MNIYESKFNCPSCRERKLRIIYGEKFVEKYACFNCGKVWDAEFIQALYSFKGNGRMNYELIINSVLKKYPRIKKRELLLLRIEDWLKANSISLTQREIKILEKKIKVLGFK